MTENWIVIPSSRPQFLESVRANLSRQTDKDFRVCVVQNGPAKGTSCDFADLLLSSEESPVAARNEALARLRKRDAFAMFMDDDDYYGPDHVASIQRAKKRGRIVGKPICWVLFEGRCLVAFKNARENRHINWVSGATLSGYASDLPDFPDREIGEDVALCSEFLKAGGEVFSTTRSHHVYVRREDAMSHTYKTSDRALLREHGVWFYVHPPQVEIAHRQDITSSKLTNYSEVHLQVSSALLSAEKELNSRSD